MCHALHRRSCGSQKGNVATIAFETEPSVSEADYLVMVEGKTASLISLAADLGACIAGAPDSNAVALHEFRRVAGHGVPDV